MTAVPLARSHRPPLSVIATAGVLAWLVAWFAEAPLADWISYDLLGLTRGSHLGDAVDFFLLVVP